MSCFMIPKDTCWKMRAMISNYWWGSHADSRRIHWQRWELLTRPKPLGGMGFRDLNLFNLAMLGNQGWRLLENPNSLCARVLKGRYYQDSDFLSASRRKHASHTWRAVLAGGEMFFRRDSFAELAMEPQHWFGGTGGSQIILVAGRSPQMQTRRFRWSQTY